MPRLGLGLGISRIVRIASTAITAVWKWGDGGAGKWGDGGAGKWGDNL